MTLGELIPALRAASADPQVERLAQLLEAWKADPSNTDDLHERVERFFANTSLQSDDEHARTYALWAAFRAECIAGRGGMTMNERLFCFDQLDAWDAAETEEQRMLVRRKVDFTAKPAR